jgi:hypothetical protein
MGLQKIIVAIIMIGFAVAVAVPQQRSNTTLRRRTTTEQRRQSVSSDDLSPDADSSRPKTSQVPLKIRTRQRTTTTTTTTTTPAPVQVEAETEEYYSYEEEPETPEPTNASGQKQATVSEEDEEEEPVISEDSVLKEHKAPSSSSNLDKEKVKGNEKRPTITEDDEGEESEEEKEEPEENDSLKPENVEDETDGFENVTEKRKVVRRPTKVTSSIKVTDKVGNQKETKEEVEDTAQKFHDDEEEERDTDKEGATTQKDEDNEDDQDEKLDYIQKYVATRDGCQGSLERVTDEDIEQVIDDKELVEGYRTCLLAKRGEKRETCTCVGWNLSSEYKLLKRQ